MASAALIITGIKACHMAPRRALLAVGAMWLLALTLGACAQGSASYEEGQREKQSAVWLEQQSDFVVCRTDNHDLGYPDALTSKVPWRDEAIGEHLDCPDLLKSGLNVARAGDPILNVREGGLAQYNKAATSQILENSDQLRTARAVQWMNLRRDIKECVHERHAAGSSMGFFRGLPDQRWGFYGGPPSTPVLIRNCDNHLISITHADIPPGAPACGQADIPACRMPALP